MSHRLRVAASIFFACSLSANAQRTPQRTATKAKIPVGGNVTDIALAPDGKTVAVAVFKGAVSTYDMATGKAVREYAKLGDRTAVAFSPDGKLLAAGGNLGLKVWDTETGKVKYDFPTKKIPETDQLFFTPNGKTLIAVVPHPTTVREKSSITIWDLATKKLNVILPKGTDREFEGVVLSPDGQTLYYGEISHGGNTPGGVAFPSQGTLKARDMKTGKEKTILSSFICNGSGSSFSSGYIRPIITPDGKTILYDMKHIVDLATASSKVNFNYTGFGLALTPDGTTLAVNKGGGRVMIFDAATGKQLLLLAPYVSRDCSSTIPPAFTPDLRSIVVMSGDNNLWIWDIADIMKDRGAK